MLGISKRKFLNLEFLSIFGIIFIFNLFLTPKPASALVVAEQTQNYSSPFYVWQMIQELGNNLSGTAQGFTFRVSTSASNINQFDYTASNSRIYDKDNNNSYIAGCIPAGTNPADRLEGLTFTTSGVPAGYEDVTIDFSCRNYNFIPGHRYLIWITNANMGNLAYGKILFAAASYNGTSNDYFSGGGLRYAHGNPYDYDHNSGRCNPVSYIWGDLTLNPISGCNIWGGPKNDLYFILNNTTPEPTPTPTPSPSPSPTPTPLPSKTPLIFIPGIGGSEFKSTQTFTPGIKECGTVPEYTYHTDELVWINKIMMANSGCDDYLDILKLKTDGTTPEYPQITLNDTIYNDSYGDLVNFLQENNDYKLGENLFIFPYDWRKDIATTSTPLNQLIEEAKQKSGNQKVDIVAHSMGGLVAKNYIKDPTQAAKVRKLITLGTPYLGSVKLLKALRYGDYFGPSFLFGLIGINPSETQDLIQNFPGTFELLPSKAYYEFYNNSDPEHLTPFRDDSDIDKNGVTGSLNFNQLQQLLAYFGHNMNLFNIADNFHSQLDKIWQNGTNGVETTLIAGSGKPTLIQLHEQNEIKFHFGVEGGLQVNKREEILANGDDTVPLFSASLTDGVKSIADLSKIFYVNQKHGSLTNRNSGPAMQLVKNILDNKTEIPTGVQDAPYKLKGKTIIIQSPVELNIYDSSGKHTGPTTNGDFENNIPGSFYDTLDSTKMIWLPNDGQYDIKLNATDNGTFDLKIRSFDNDINNQTIIYKDIPITTATKAELNYDTTSQAPPSLDIDTDGNGTVDKIVDADAVLGGNQVYDQQAPISSIQLNGNQGNNRWYKSDVTITLNATDEINGSGILKTEYSLDDGKTINRYSAPFTVSQEGITKIQVKSTDKAGNEEYPLKTAEIKIDKTAPVVSLSVNPKELWPVNKKMIDVLISGSAVDTISDIASKTFTVLDEYQKLNPTISDFNQTIKLEAYRDGNDTDGRIYTIKVTAEDLAGNQQIASTQVVVPHDQDKK